MNANATLTNFQKLSVLKILLLSLLTGCLGYGISFLLHLNSLTHLMFGWDIFCTVLIALHWWMFLHTSAAETKLKAVNQDENRGEIFAIVLLSTVVGMVAVIILLLHKNGTSIDLVIAILGMLLSWTLVHTTFAIRYAHKFYSNKDSNTLALDFPNEKHPDFIDFAYFSFVIGMTFQVSDVEINSREIRRIVLLHSVISFLFNTIIVALTINALAGLAK